MTLYLEHNGEFFQIQTDVEDFNLDKPLARADICDSIAAGIKRFRTLTAE